MLDSVDLKRKLVDEKYRELDELQKQVDTCCNEINAILHAVPEYHLWITNARALGYDLKLGDRTFIQFVDPMWDVEYLLKFVDQFPSSTFNIKVLYTEKFIYYATNLMIGVP